MLQSGRRAAGWPERMVPVIHGPVQQQQQQQQQLGLTVCMDDPGCFLRFCKRTQKMRVPGEGHEPDQCGVH